MKKCNVTEAHSFYAKLGYRTIPIVDKRPAVKNWPNIGICSASTAKYWARRFPGANIGIVSGPGIVVNGKPTQGDFFFDVDGEIGRASLAALTDEHGPLPRTPRARTGGGGEHYMLEWPEGLEIKNSASRIGPGLDIRGRAGQAVVEPSVSSKGPYKWIVGPDEVRPAAAPQWLLNLIEKASAPKAATPTPATPKAATPTPATTKTPAPAQAVSPLPAGQWWPLDAQGYHVALLALVGGLLRRGMIESQVVDLLTIILPPRVTPQENELTKAVSFTRERLARGEACTGWPALKAQIGDDAMRTLLTNLGMEFTPPSTTPAPTTAPTPPPAASTTAPDANAPDTDADAPDTDAPDTAPDADADPPDAVTVRRAAELRAGSIRTTTDLARKAAKTHALTYGAQVSSGVLSYDVAVRLIDQDDINIPLVGKKRGTPESRMKRLVEGTDAAFTRPRLPPAPAALAQRMPRDDMKAGDPVTYEAGGRLKISTDYDTLIVVPTYADGPWARLTIAAPHANVATVAQVAARDFPDRPHVVLWHPAEIAREITHLPQEGKGTAGLATKNLTSVCTQAETVRGLDQVPTDFASRMIRRWSGRSTTEKTSMPSLDGWKFFAHAKNDDVMTNLIAAALQKKTCLLLTKAGEVKATAAALLDLGIDARSVWTPDLMMGSDDEPTVWVQSIDTTPPKSMWKVQYIYATATLKSPVQAFIARLLDVDPRSRIVHHNVGGGHQVSMTIPAIEASINDHTTARQNIFRGTTAPATPIQSLSDAHNTHTAEATQYAWAGRWGVVRMLRWTVYDFGGEYLRGEPDPTVGVAFGELLEKKQEELDELLNQRALGTETNSLNWLEMTREARVSDTDLPAFLLSGACAIAGSGVVAHEPFEEGDPDGQLRVDRAIGWGTHGYRRRVKSIVTGTMQALRLPDRAGLIEIAEERTGFMGHATAHAERVQAGWIMADIAKPRVQAMLLNPRDDATTPSTPNNSSRKGGKDWCGSAGGRATDPALLDPEEMRAEYIRRTQARGMSRCVYPNVKDATQYVGQVLLWAGITTEERGRIDVPVEGREKPRSVRKYGIALADLREIIYFSRCEVARRLGWVLPDLLDRTSSKTAWSVAVDIDTGQWVEGMEPAFDVPTVASDLDVATAPPAPLPSPPSVPSTDVPSDGGVSASDGGVLATRAFLSG